MPIVTVNCTSTKGGIIMKINLSEKEKEGIESIFREVVRSNPESNESRALAENPDGITDIICKSVETYVYNVGLPETDEHGAMDGTMDSYYEYLEHGLSYEDCRVILED